MAPPLRLSPILAFALAGCFHPTIPDGELGCGDDQRCPSGMVCEAGLCFNNATVSQFDFGIQQISPVYGSGKLGAIDLTNMTGTLTLDTETGQIDLVGGTTKTIVPAQATAGNFALAQPSAGGPKVAIWSFTSLIVPSAITVTGKSGNGSVPVLAATGSLTIAGTVDVVGFGGLDGAPGMPARPNGSSPEHGSGGGGGSDGSGGGGGGDATGGTNGGGTSSGKGGLAFGVPTIIPVFFGGGGGGGGGMLQTSMPGAGGNGGGAIVLLAHALRISGTIDASGADGQPANPNSTSAAGGGGGGAGGNILLSGDSVTMDPGSMLTALGGIGGPGANGGMDGGDGSDGRVWVGSGAAVMGTLSGLPAAVTGSALTSFPR